MRITLDSARLLAHPLEASELLLGLLAHGLGHAGLFDLRAVLLDDRGVVLAELLADRLHLLAQEVLALLLLGAGLDVLADALAHLQLGQPLALEPEGELEPLGHVDRLEQLDLLLVGDVGRVAAGVGQRARLGDAAHEGGDAAVVAAQLEDLLDHGAVLALEVAGAAVDGDVVGLLLDLDVQTAVGQGLGGAGDAAVQALEGDGAARRRAGGRARRPRRRCRRRRIRCSWRGTSRTRSSSPASTASVSDMPGKTTASSNGTRRSATHQDLHFR